MVHNEFTIMQMADFVRCLKIKPSLLSAAVVIAFFLCWAPFHAQRLGYVYFKESNIFRTFNEYLMYISGICYYISSTINPILYNVMSAKYRQAFRKTLCGLSGQNGQIQQFTGMKARHLSMKLLIYLFKAIKVNVNYPFCEIIFECRAL